LIDPAETNALRLIHGSADAQPGWYVDRFGDVLLSQSAGPITREQREQLETWLSALGCQAAYHKILLRQPDHPQSPSSVAPQLVLGHPQATVIHVLENGVRYQIDLKAGYSVGLFLDQRDNRRALLTHRVAPEFHLPFAAPAPPELLNTFAYTGGFSVCAALSGARTTSIDLSAKYLDWAKTNFRLNQLDPEDHSFVTGDVFDWLRRLTRKHRKFTFILLDPPTFSSSKSHGVFRAEKDYATLVAAALPLLEQGGILFASANTLRLPAKTFVDAVSQSVSAARRRILRQHFATQGFDFPITRAEPAHLKCLWLQIQ
jgi:23S rRNA (cytosine1962-C5)-methyltransferase